MIIYRLTDRIPVTIGEVKFWLSPLSFEQKVNIQSATKMQGGVEVADGGKMGFLSLKYSVKGIEGVKLADGSDYTLEFEPSGVLTDECVSELVQLAQSVKLITTCATLVNSIEDHKIEGVTIDLKGVVSSKKKESA